MASFLAWQDVIAIAAIDCSNKNNELLCGKFGIQRVPTLKFFSMQAKSHDTGLKIKNHFSTDEMIDTVTELLIKEQQEGRGSLWPTLTPYRY